MLSLAAGCEGFQAMKKTLTQVVELASGIAKEFGEPNVYVNISNTALTVTFTNSKLADLPEGERAETARNVATYVRDHYPGYAALSQVNVGFKSQSGGAGITVSKSSVPYSFATSDLGPGPDSTERVQDSARAKAKTKAKTN